MRNKKHYFKVIISFLLALLFLFVFATSAFAHRLTLWANYYTLDNINSTYSFAFMNAAHIDGKNLKYCWGNDTTKSKLSKYMTPAFSTGWRGIISGTETTSVNAHISIFYDPVYSPTNAAAQTVLISCDNNQHIRPGFGDANITYFQNAYNSSSSEDSRQKVMTHELGHLWGIEDLYDKNQTLESIYSKNYYYVQATRHDMNALRIGLNNLWFNPGTGGVWKYQESPGVFYDRGDVDKNHAVQAADARLVLRVASNLESISSVQQRIADVDGVDGITASDARLILQYASNQISSFPLDDNRV